MKIKLSPVRIDEQLSASVSGDILVVNGEELDFGQLREGDVLPHAAVGCKWLVGDILRIDGEIQLTLVLPHGLHAPHETRFPVAFEEPLAVSGGIVPLPLYDEVQS